MSRPKAVIVPLRPFSPRFSQFPEVRDAGGGSCLPHGRYVTFQMAEVAVPRNLFREILRRIDELRRRPAPAEAEGIDGEEKATGGVCLDGEKMAEWPSTRGPVAKIMPSDGCKGGTVPMAAGKWYYYHGFGWYPGNVG